MISKELAKKVLAEHYGCGEDDIADISGANDVLRIYFDDMEIKTHEYLSIYHYGVLLKEYIEDYARSISLKGVWIDLNDLSKDEGYFFRHCHEVYLDLKEYENNKCCMS